jgi:hypothetical protein
MKFMIAGLLLTLMTSAGWAERWECKQLRDVILSPPYYVDQEETDVTFAIKVGNGEIEVLRDAIDVFLCGPDGCRQPLSAQDFLIKGENEGSTFILSSVGSQLGFRSTYSVTSKPSVGETMIQMGVCSPLEGQSSQ